jgi:hypothetical protein
MMMIVKVPQGTAIVCIRRPRPARCSVCKQHPHTKLCDGPGKRAGKDCDAKLCDACAQHVGPKDYCPAHRVERGGLYRMAPP